MASQVQIPFEGVILQEHSAPISCPTPNFAKGSKDIILRYRQEVRPMPDSGPNEQSLELREVSPSPPLTVAQAPAPLLIPGGWRIEGLPGPVREAGPCAQRRLVEFFTAKI